MVDKKEYWDYLDTLPRKKVLEMVENELLDVRGLSIIKNILDKYNFSHVSIDHRLRFTLKRSALQSPKSDLEKKQGKG